VLALLSLLKRDVKKFPRWLFLMGIVGAGLLLGDGMITPAISVISAMEGLKIVLPEFAHLVWPVSFMILMGLFLCQRFGTGKISFIFGPILLLWFIVIGILGAVAIYHNPSVLEAINPYYAWTFFQHGGWHAYLMLGGVFLVITGAEAMYADLGHFGRRSIRIGWFAVALPALLLNYFGQGANLLTSPESIVNSFLHACAWLVCLSIIDSCNSCNYYCITSCDHSQFFPSKASYFVKCFVHGYLSSILLKKKRDRYMFRKLILFWQLVHCHWLSSLKAQLGFPRLLEWLLI